MLPIVRPPSGVRTNIRITARRFRSSWVQAFSATDRRSMIRLGYSYCNCTFNTEITKSDAFDAARDHLTRTGPHAW